MDEKPEAMQGYFGPGPGTGSGWDAYQEPFRRRFPFFFFPIFVFRIPPRRFIFIPIPRRRRRRGFDAGMEDCDPDMCIHCVSDAEWECMMRLGIPECEVVMER